MKKYFPLLLLSAVLFSCKTEKKAPVTDVEVATGFVRDILDNKFDEAEQYLLKDEMNKQFFELFKTQYHNIDNATLEKYKRADIIVNEINNPVDSVCIFNYSNSYRKTDTTILKVVRVEGKWLIDLKHTFSGNE